MFLIYWSYDHCTNHIILEMHLFISPLGDIFVLLSVPSRLYSKFHEGCHGNVIVFVFFFQAGYLGGISLVIALRGRYSDGCKRQLIR
jgi:hypothetical protein